MGKSSILGRIIFILLFCRSILLNSWGFSLELLSFFLEFCVFVTQFFSKCRICKPAVKISWFETHIWNRLDEPLLMLAPKPLLTEFDIHQRLESCGKVKIFIKKKLCYWSDLMTASASWAQVGSASSSSSQWPSFLWTLSIWNTMPSSCKWVESLVAILPKIYNWCVIHFSTCVTHWASEQSTTLRLPLASTPNCIRLIFSSCFDSKETGTKPVLSPYCRDLYKTREYPGLLR